MDMVSKMMVKMAARGEVMYPPRAGRPHGLGSLAHSDPGLMKAMDVQSTVRALVYF